MNDTAGAGRLRVSQVIALADLDTVVAQDVVSGGDVKIEIRQRMAEQDCCAELVPTASVARGPAPRAETTAHAAMRVMFFMEHSLPIDRFDRSGIVAGPDELLYAHATARG